MAFFRLRSSGRLQAGAVVGDYFQGFDVVVGFAGHDGVDAAGVVADHAADGAAVVAGGIGREGEVMFFGGVAEGVEHDAGLHAGDAAGGIDLEDRAMYLEKSRTTATLQHCPASEVPPPRQSSGAPNSRQSGDRGEDVVGIVGKNDADGDLAVVGAVGRVEGAGAIVEANVSCQSAAKLCAQGFGES